ncbi:unnamed protein product [Phytophthora fragariaefolia]|uniref:Unnamed protein product n=1 Tax=Phytophthora fragariaefolia TaxID=1490495 RepID=A0A9W6XTK5_9STRA|nr:unnamed protein product [Phytophthora fragariaefolia]
MSFLLDEEESLATLEELLAFIECPGQCSTSDGEEDGARGGNEGGSSPVSVGEFYLPGSADPSTEKKATIRRRKRTGWSSSTGLQRRKRAELQFLRQHVLDLEAYLQQLKLPPATEVGGAGAEAACPWQELARAELLKRVQAEEINRLLKIIMNNQLQIHDALKSVFEESTICKK